MENKSKLNELHITRETAEHYVSLMIKKDILLTETTWNEVLEIMEDGCREILNDLTAEIDQKIKKQGIYYEAN